MTLVLEEVHAGYGPLTVLGGVSFHVEAGTCAALVGRNAAGKTTLLRVAAGVCQPRTGQVLLGGEDVTSMPSRERVRRGLCFIPETGGVFGGLTVGDNLALFSDGVDAKDGSERAYAIFPDLRERTSQLAASLSGGEQQMLAMSRAVVQRPSVVLLDEVSLGLAPRYVDRIFKFVQELVAGGAAVVVVDQYVSRSLKVADTVHVLENGRMVFSGLPEHLPPELAPAGYFGMNCPGPCERPPHCA